MTDDQDQPIPEITYPREWEYTIIGPDRDKVTAAAASIVTDRPYDLAEANVSRTGKYVSVRLTLTVSDEADRDRIFQALRDHVAVKIVL